MASSNVLIIQSVLAYFSKSYALHNQVKQRRSERHLPREHMNPSPTYGAMQVHVKLSRLLSSSHMAFSSHGMPAIPVQSSTCG